jgi:hypothetical protein
MCFGDFPVIVSQGKVTGSDIILGVKRQLFKEMVFEQDMNNKMPAPGSTGKEKSDRGNSKDRSPEV